MSGHFAPMAPRERGGRSTGDPRTQARNENTAGLRAWVVLRSLGPAKGRAAIGTVLFDRTFLGGHWPLPTPREL
jgi:hypothetical protein